MDPKSLPVHDKRNPKQVDKGRLGVFMGYVNETTKQWRLYAPDLGHTITVSTIDFLESKRGGDLDLRIRGARPQGTPSDPIDRIPVGRPKETLRVLNCHQKRSSITSKSGSQSNTNTTESKPGGNSHPKVNQDLRPKQPQSVIANESEKGQDQQTKAKRPASLSEEEFDTRQTQENQGIFGQGSQSQNHEYLKWTH